MNRSFVLAAPAVLIVAGALALLSLRHARSSLSLARRRVTADQSEHQRRLKAQDRALVAGLQGQLRRLHLPPSKLLSGHSLAAWVYLPPGYAKSSARYPVVYLLHGWPGGVRDPFVNAGVHRVAEQLIVSHQIQPMILVGWDGFGPRGLNDPTFYLNRTDGRYQMESWMRHELVPWTDGHFRTLAKPQARALVGFSAGGYGAANLSFKHPDVFAVAASHAGFFDPGDFARAMQPILGPPSARWNDNAPLQRARRLPRGGRIHFYLDCGRDDRLFSEFKKMQAELKARDIDFEAHVFAGAHDWTFLHAHYFDSLRFCDKRFRELATQRTSPTSSAKADSPR